MFRLDHQKAVSFCDGLRRRDFLHAGSAGMLGLGLTDFLSLKAQGAVHNDKSDINVIMLFLVGGPSQLDTWDMKPNAPSEIRGPYKPIKTNVPGIEISEIFPRMARHADKWSLIRTLYHTAAAVHDTGHQMMQTGRLFQGGLNHPHMGSVLGKLRGPNGDVPPHVLLPRPIGNTGGNMPHGQDAGYLGKAHDPFVLNADPSEPNFEVPDMLPPDYISAVRIKRRRKWRDMIDAAVKHFEEVPDAKLLDTTFHQAYTLMSSKKARAAFDLAQESDDTRKRYGWNRFGQSCLMAKRLVEAGVRFVTVNMFETVFDEITWDIHGSSPFSPIECYSNLVGPMFDNGFTSLVEDLSRTGLLDNTMIVATGEFGRTPKINPAGGRDHWPACWPVVMAGGGIQGGRVVGESDDIGGAPKSRPTTPAEVTATMYHGLGIDLETELPGPQNRPIRVVDHGVEPIMELFT
ncbi:MAG: DUF1501 domain-containing protein [Bryobacterales bacterium]|nr:DUF1501 domain-containing protein [Bryobacterales bacterium]